MKKVDGILCGDLHLMEKKPVCRMDAFESEQFVKLKFIDDLAMGHDCPVYCTGDFFDNWKPSPELISKTIDCLNAEWFSIYGDHDLQNHSLDMKHKSGLTTLAKADKITIVNGGHGNNKNKGKLKNPVPSVEIKGRKLFLWHVLTWQNELPFPGCKASNAKKLLKKYPQFDLIATGDNHKPFVEEHKGRLLVNVGSMLRIRADQMDYKPAVWLYYAKSNSVNPIYIPIKDGVISREHIEVKQERDNRIDAYVSSMLTGYETEMSFETNLETHYAKNKTKKKIKQIIKKASNEQV